MGCLVFSLTIRSTTRYCAEAVSPNNNKKPKNIRIVITDFGIPKYIHVTHPLGGNRSNQETISYQMRKTWNRSRLLAIKSGPARLRAGI